ncbi:MAG TPA: prolipoprotein diacylglyceryl transferase [Candidatus Omnitrophota bacterium]|nr:prolipoprotein diacylglyceryl transferase [Candidatus Omnitrophota bacterium]HPS20008.1 prolipoprotein diacylglyceryl transferase [Candidatus Omnitrophota bacterium]
MHRVLFSIGSFDVYSYGFFVALAFLVCVLLMKKDSERAGIAFDRVLDCIIWTLILGLFGGRILFVVINWRDYIEHPIRILAFREGGMAFQGSLILGIVASAIVCRVHKVPYLKFLDIMAPYAALGQAIGRIGCFMNGCCYGRETHSAIHVVFPADGIQRIPVQLYYTFALSVIYIILLRVRSAQVRDGVVSCTYLVLFSMVGFFMEFLRADNPGIFFCLTLSQLIFAGLFLTGIGGLLLIKKLKIIK